MDPYEMTLDPIDWQEPHPGSVKAYEAWLQARQPGKSTGAGKVVNANTLNVNDNQSFIVVTR